MRQTQHTCRPTTQAEAIVHRVNAVDRELTVFVAGSLVSFYVPPGCPVILHGERVKLRMVQPRDRVRVTCSEQRGSLVAHAIEVQPGPPPPGHF